MADDRLLKIDNLSISFGRGDREIQAVRNISFDIRKGETLALVGESGSGKSVTALSILQLLPYPLAWHPNGSISFDNTAMVGASEDKLSKIRGDKIGIIFQEPMTSLNPLHTIEKQVGEIIFLHKQLERDIARRRIIDLLHQVGLAEAENRLLSYPHELSGGQRQRIMIAMALANDPDLLIADEPTTALDVTIQAQILTLLKDLQGQRNMSMLLITHDLGIVRKVADRVCVMTNGRIVEQGSTEQIFTNPDHSYTQHLLASEPDGKPVTSVPNSPVVMEAENLKVWFPIKRGILRRVVGHVKAVDGITVKVKQGQTVGVVGESGSGKTTLALGLLRLEKSVGPIVFIGRNIQNLGWKELRPLRREMQIVFQDPYGSLSPRMSIGQIIEEGLLVHKPDLDSNERRKIIHDALVEVDLDPGTLDRHPHEFSGGQRQRIAIARTIVLKPSFIVLDEPTSALDMSVQSQIIQLLRDLQQRHKLTYMFISHDLKVVRALADEVIVMRKGKVVEQGPAKEIFDAPQETYTKALMAAAFNIEAVEDGTVST